MNSKVAGTYPCDSNGNVVYEQIYLLFFSAVQYLAWGPIFIGIKLGRSEVHFHRVPFV